MTKSLFTILLCVLSVVAIAQPNKRSVTISLDNRKPELPLNFPFFIESVLDGRSVPYALGMGRKGAGSQIAPVFFEKEMTDELLAFIRTSNPAGEGRRPVTMRVNKLYVYESQLTNLELAGLEINLSFLEKDASGHWVELYNVGTVLEKETSIDATLMHRKNIEAGLEYCFGVLARQFTTGVLWQYPFDINQHGDSIAQRFAVCHLSGVPESGYFRTFEDFRDNLPQKQVQFVKKESKVLKNGNTAAEFERTDGRKMDYSADQMWGLSDGKHVYLNTGGRFLQLDRVAAGDYRINIKVTKKSGHAGAVIGSVFGGLVGGAIGALVDEATEKEDIELARLDLMTAGLIPLKVPTNRRQEGRLVLYSDSFYKENTIAEVRANGQLKGKVEPGAALRLRFVPPYEPIELCVNIGGVQQCEMVHPDLFLTDYYSVYFRKGKVRLLEMDDEERESLRSKISNGKVIVNEER